MELGRLSPAAFRRFLGAAGIRRFFLVWDEETEEVRASHPELAPLARLLAADRRDFDRHEAVFGQVAPETGVLQGAFIHRTCRGQAAGGVRFWRYDTVEDYLRDGLRLARGMTHKNALAGLWWGGGKGVMVDEPREGAAGAVGESEAAPGSPRRRRIYEEYGELLSSLRGCYVTAEDVGTSVEDMAAVFSRTRFTTCIPPALGGSGNPSAPTARGVVRGMEAALAHRGAGGLAGKTVAVQGLGHVGEPLVELLRERGVARVIGCDLDPARCAALNRRFAAGRGAAAGGGGAGEDAGTGGGAREDAGAGGAGGDRRFAFAARTSGRDDLWIFEQPADVFAPCATGSVLGPRTIPRLAAGIVCGAANNQLEDPERDDLALHRRGVLYMPDFLVNRMGIVNCADEQYGYVGEEDPRLAAHLGSAPAAQQGAGDTWDNSIYNLSLAVLAEAERRGEPPASVALRLAERRSCEAHPIWGHRGAAIIRGLTRPGPGGRAPWVAAG
ncbi:MAG TPA: Glu/Leu/Phe/Val dehydrogenase dimerization domain-containing protein [Thermoanaerobaculia bacterium]|nr:Glu/Leu/Phe/Val dehydrogenase dimerization domain-containing protein [Thermoanaerobaculia bacterium]